ncbi:VCBS repeat-containing protein [Flagellimonas flava]|uniref:Repeat domain-containing protein n=1 Tax=Flagellimonas flava TaxID=570519 RepID=A0A1M5JY16_9FLAO|nr:VCBS repeat-containing protein [Allomuricauda flava]SHG45275.1 Repeat domain-containing protein [Allomuricauda flava]
MFVNHHIWIRSVIVFLTLALSAVSCEENTTKLFHDLSPKETGVLFSNTLVIGGEPSVLEFEYMYNGAGVAVADFDQDGLQDIYFTGNMVSNRLYRNLGEFKFEDITTSASVGTSGWSNGVAIVDINQDGFPDIYVCKGGPRGSSDEDRANLLFVNNGMKDGKLSFTEEASKWGIADSSYSVQANFFDYDGDGDLDMYLLSNALVDYNRNTSRPKDWSGKAPSVDKLFRNNGDATFTDVSREAKILLEGFGLGVEVYDFNEDGWVDIYVSNDFLTDDFLYINQKDGTFKNEISKYMGHLTFNGMGNDIADINNDGLMDVVVLDMLPPDNKRWKLTMMGNNYDEHHNALSNGYQPQYIRNTLQINNGNGSFSEVGQIAGISATEWSWSALLSDYDHDGKKDLFVTNGYRQDITNLDFMVYGNTILSMGSEQANREKRLEALNKLPGIKRSNYLFKNEGELQFKDISKEAGITKPTFSNGAAYADFDNDGDFDLVINNIDDPASILRNNTKVDSAQSYLKFRFKGAAPNLEGIGSQVEIHYQGQLQKQYFTPYRGYLSSVESSLHFGLGDMKKIDSAIVTWPNKMQEVLKNIPVNQELVLHQNNAQTSKKNGGKKIVGLFKKIDSIGMDFTHTENDFVDFKIQPLLPHMHSKNGPGMAVGDANGDGLEDVYIAGATGQPGTLKIQGKDGSSFSEIVFQDSDSEDMGALFFDADSDGDQDLYVVSGGSSAAKGSPAYQDRIYENDGTGTYTLVDALPESLVSGSVVTGADYDKDGDIDLFVGGRVQPGEYPMSPKSSLLKNESSIGNVKFSADHNFLNNWSELGMVTAALWTDFDNDSWMDLIVVGEFMPIRFFKNNEGNLQEITEQIALKGTNGWWNSIASGDFDNDGDSDYILGNFGLNSRYKASVDEPLCIYAKDYDKNGQIDPVMCYYIDGKNYIAHSRNDLIDQINAMRVRFRTYSEYAEATFEESFTEGELADAHIVKSETFASSYLENLGEGRFALKPLPITMQTAPLYGINIGDYNQDSHLDVLAVGNFYSGEVFNGRYDASIGWLMTGDGKGSFETLKVDESGFFVNGDAKSQVNLFANDSELILSGINNGELKIHSRKLENAFVYHPNPQDASITIHFEDGFMQKRELYYGSGYLSQGSRRQIIPKKAKYIVVKNFKGEEIKTDVRK